MISGFFFLFLSVLINGACAQDFYSLKIGSYAFEAVEKLDNGVPTLQIKVSNSALEDYPHYSEWFKVRSESSGDRLGERSFWQQIPYHKNTFSSLSINLKAELTDEAADEWSKIFLREPKAYYALLTLIDPFYLKHKKIFSSLAKMGNTQSLSYYAMRMGTPPQGISKQESQEFLKSVMDGNYQFISKENYKTDVPDLPILIVTHASSIFHSSKKIKPVLDKLIQDFKQKHSPVIFLLHNDEAEDYTWFTENRKPDFALFSNGGEHSYLITFPEVTMVGGYFDQCFRRSVQDTITRFFLTQKKELRLIFPMDGIYTGQDSTLLSDFEKAPEKFLTQVLNSLFWSKNDPYDDSMDGDKDAIGEFDLRLYQFTFIKDNKVLAVKGHGSRKIKLLFLSRS